MPSRADTVMFRLAACTGLTPTCGLLVENTKNGTKMMESSSRKSPPPCTMTFFHRGCGSPKGWYAR